MSALLFQSISIAADVAIILFICYYFFKFRAEEKQIEKQENKLDNDYHKIINNALARERKIIDDASTQANKLISEAKTTTKDSEKAVNQALHTLVTDVEKETTNAAHDVVNATTHTEVAVNEALEKMTALVQKESSSASHEFEANYQAYLKQLTQQSLLEFQTIIKGLETDLQKQLKDFHNSLLPTIEKQVEEYKQMRLKQADQTIEHVVQRASQEILNKSISLTDHQNLVIQSLEKAKKEGIFG